MPYQSWDLEDLSDIPLKCENRAESRVRQGPRWPHGLVERAT